MYSAQIIFSLCLFFLLFSQSNFDYFSFNFSFKFFTYNSERNFIFLICNGILVLIFQTSGFNRNSNPKEPQFTAEVQVSTIKENVHVKGRQNLKIMAKTEEIGSEINDLSQESELMDSEIGEDDPELLSADELNQKCEDFIKKVKQGIKNEFYNLVRSDYF